MHAACVVRRAMSRHRRRLGSKGYRRKSTGRSRRGYSPPSCPFSAVREPGGHPTQENHPLSSMNPPLDRLFLPVTAWRVGPGAVSSWRHCLKWVGPCRRLGVWWLRLRAYSPCSSHPVSKCWQPPRPYLHPVPSSRPRRLEPPFQYPSSRRRRIQSSPTLMARRPRRWLPARCRSPTPRLQPDGRP